jgi:hypothetical protein
LSRDILDQKGEHEIATIGIGKLRAWDGLDTNWRRSRGLLTIEKLKQCGYR